MEKEKQLQTLGIILIISSIILSLFSVMFAVFIGNARMAYIDEENIYFESFSVKMDDGIDIHGYLYVDKNLHQSSDHSVPTILLLQGINGRREDHFFKVFQLVKFGYAVISVEQRGHGLSGGISSFLGKEPQDMRNIIDYIEMNYKFSNSSHLALLGFSYGGGIGTILQAIDRRINVSVFYHPLASIEEVTSIIPFQNLIGITPAISNVDEIQDGMDICDPKNTGNMLLIHGKEDNLILIQSSHDLYDKVNGSKRDDIDLEIREELDHPENEADQVSFLHTIVWFEHFYHNSSIDHVNREDEIEYIKLYDFNYPIDIVPQVMIIIGSILIFIGLTLLIVPKKIIPFSEEVLFPFDPIYKQDSRINEEGYKKDILIRVILYIIPVVVCGLIFAILNPSFVYGYLLCVPLVTIVLLQIYLNYKHYRSKSDWEQWLKKDLKIFCYGCVLTIGPILFLVLLFNLNSAFMMAPQIPFFTSTALGYFIAFISSIMMDSLLIRDLEFKHTTLLFGLRPLTVLIFYLFVPIPPFIFLGGVIIQILFISLIGIVLWIILMIVEIIGNVYKNRIIVVMIISLPIIVGLTYLFFRIV